MYPKIYDLTKNRPQGNWGKFAQEDDFTCRECEAHVYSHPMVSGVQNRNHCPYCLWSRHVDLWKAGDRLSACKAGMEPIGLTVKMRPNKYGSWNCGELMVIHRCEACGKLSINRIAADDLSDNLMNVFRESARLDADTREKLAASGIRLLQATDQKLVLLQLCINN